MWHDQEEWIGCRGSWFWDIGKNSVQIPLFYIVFSNDKFVITLQPDIQLLWDLDQNEAFWSFEKVVQEKRNWNFRQVTHFPWLIMSHMYPLLSLILTNYTIICFNIIRVLNKLKCIFRLKEYYEIVDESRPLSAFFTTHADFLTEIHFYSWN